MTVNKADIRFQEYETAKKYVEKVGKPEYHFEPTSYGKWCKTAVTTEVNHQESSGATNYWKHSAFDEALGEVILKNIKALTQETLELMLSRANQELLKEESELKERLEKIAKIKLNA